ncbi:MAG: M28 family peptidase, partial [Gemmatimonadetes bacterium]|nr:M28 family peptidase [Gemmatimonadota bacterium]
MKRLVVCALMVAVLACKGERGGGAPATGAALGLDTAKLPQFDEKAAYRLLQEQVAFGPRVPGTPGHQKQLDWMVAYLRERADSVEVQSFEATGPKGEPLKLANVIARFNPRASDRILLLAHWDTRPTADNEPDSLKRKQPIPGANDGASGVAVLMQLADVLKRHSQPLGVDLLFTDGEDYTDAMYLGSEYFAGHLPPGYRPLYGILVDMVGDQSPVFPIEPTSQQAAPEVVDRVWRTAEDLGLSRYFPRSPGTPVDDDHVPLIRAGIHTIDIIDFDYGPGNAYWHTLEDTVEHTSPEGLGAVGRTLVGLIYSGG